MSIVNLMKADRICARADKDHSKFATLTHVIGNYDLEKSKKPNLDKSEDDVMIPVLKLAISHAKSAAEEYKKLGDAKRREDSDRDVILLEGYLPEQLTTEDLEEMVAEFKAEGKKMPDFMKHLRENYKDQFDGGTAAAIAKSELV